MALYIIASTPFTYFRLSHYARRMLKVAKWDDDDAISHDPLRMRITNLTIPNLT
jgi:hypothetical protein